MSQLIGHSAVQQSGVDQIVARHPQRGNTADVLSEPILEGDTILVCVTWDHHVSLNSSAAVSTTGSFGPHDPSYQSVAGPATQTSSPTSWGQVFRRVATADDEGRTLWVRPLSGGSRLSTNSLNVHVLVLRDAGAISLTQSPSGSGVRRAAAGEADVPGAVGLQVAVLVEHARPRSLVIASDGYAPVRGSFPAYTSLATLVRPVAATTVKRSSDLESHGPGFTWVLFASSAAPRLGRRRTRHVLATNVQQRGRSIL